MKKAFIVIAALLLISLFPSCDYGMEARLEVWSEAELDELVVTASKGNNVMTLEWRAPADPTEHVTFSIPLSPGDWTFSAVACRGGAEVSAGKIGPLPFTRKDTAPELLINLYEWM